MPEPQNDAVNALVLNAMMQALDQQKRDELVRKALATLIAPQKAARNGYGYGADVAPSVLEEAFNDALRISATTIIREMVNSDAEIGQKIRSLCVDAVNKAFANSDMISTKMAEAFTNALLGSKY